MKKKPLNFLLGAAVVVIWGLIFYKIFDAYAADAEEAPAPVSHFKEKAYNDFAFKKDTSRLQLNYRDPFKLSTPVLIDTPRRAASVKPRLPVPVKPAVNWDFVRYSGYIANPGTKKVFSMLVINGKSVMLAEGETAEQVKLLKNMRDSVKISFHNATKHILRNTTAI